MSLESDNNIGVLSVARDGTIQKQRYRRAVDVRSGSENISEAEQGSTGTRESLTSPHERMRTDGPPHDQGTGLHRKHAAPVVMIRISSMGKVVSVPRETEGKEKDEGSLSTPIVPYKSREIWTAESR